MTGIRQLEERLRAWRSFFGIAGATRNLAAAHALRWSEIARRTETYRERCETLHAAYPAAPLSEDAPTVVLALGTDHGLCGPLNRLVAEQLAEVRRPATPVLVVGERLHALAGDDAVGLSAPTSWERIEVLAAELETLLGPPGRQRLVTVLATGVDPDGRPQISTQRESARPTPVEAEVAELVDPEFTANAVASLARHARLVATLARAANSEAEARWRTMNRAHDAAGRRIQEQQRALDRRRQELVTQEMLEVRQGARGRGPSSEPGATTTDVASRYSNT